MPTPFPLAYLPDSFEFVAVIVVLTLSLMMMFVGSRLIQWLSFVVVGLMMASAGAMLGDQYLGLAGGVIGFVGGFVLGGASTLLLLPLGMGMAVGLVCYSLAQTFVGIVFVPVLVGLVGFSYGFLLTDLLLPAISGVVGGGLLFGVGLALGFPVFEVFLLALAVSSAGVATQSLLARRARDLFGEPRIAYRNRRARKQQDAA